MSFVKGMGAGMAAGAAAVIAAIRAPLPLLFIFIDLVP